MRLLSHNGFGLLVVSACLMAAVPADARFSMSGKDPVTDPVVPEAAKRAGFEQKLNDQVSLDLMFRDHTGAEVRLGDLLKGKPAILNLVYYECPMLCTEVLNGLLDAVKAVPFSIGDEYSVLTVSFDPSEGPELAAAKRENYLKEYGRASASSGWSFLTGDQASVEAITKAVGFSYAYDEKSGDYGHASGLVVLTPDGHISRYLFGIVYPPQDLRLSLVDASEGKIGSRIDQLLLLCFHYDPIAGKYSLAIMRMLRGLAAITVVAVGAYLIVAFLGRPGLAPVPANGPGVHS